jgi:hypothetical protein
MNEQNKNIEMVEENNDCIKIEVEKESKLKGLISKAKTTIKKHGKTVTAVAAVGVAALIGCALGKSREESIIPIDVDDECYQKSTETEDFHIENEYDNEE